MEFRDHGNKRVLIVDDQKEIHDDFTDMLRPSRLEGASTEELASAFVSEEEQPFLPEFELLHATSGEEACEIARAGRESNRPIAVAYVDIRMPPGIDGVETTRRMREIDRDVEIVVMTAYSGKSLPEIVGHMKLPHKLLYIRKPFATEEIQQITLSLVGKWNIEQELAEKRRLLTVSHQRLEAVLDATGDAMAMYDAAGHLVFANQGYEKMLGLSESELKKISPEAFEAEFKRRFHEPDLPDVEEGFLFEGKGTMMEESTATGELARQRLFYRSSAPVHGNSGEVIGDLYVYRDVSKEIEVERMKAEVLRLRTELETTYSFAGMVGASPPMQQMYSLIQQAADSEITVLIRGESGTGKELVAKSFHFNGSRKAGPFLAINCAAIPEALIESELFGHEQGAFTGATTGRIGAFERAKGGTILLDEIGDMKPAVQAKLLRVLQEREIQRVGGPTIPVDVRVIAATNKDLEGAVKAGEFREDLFYRVTAFPIVIPPLRERREDIPVLAKHFLKKHSKRIDKSLNGISTGALRLLLQYDWPGNVRELENAIERAVLLETTEVLQANNLPPQLSPLAPAKNDSSSPTAVLPLAQVERQSLVHALEVSANNVTQAARALGLNRATLYRKLKKYGLTAS